MLIGGLLTKGIKGAASVGPKGPQGPKGAVGDAFQGDKGLKGPTGTKGPGGDKGATGPKGPKGVKGPTAPNGPQGVKGQKGATGPKGPKGPAGQKGAQGPSSDIRLKDSVKGLKGNLAKLLKLKGLYFDWKQDEFTLKTHANLKGRSIGFIAQDVEEVISDVVIDDSEGIKSVQYGLITAVALGSLK